MKIEWHHILMMLLIVFVGAALVRRNFLGVPSMVDSLVGTVTNLVPSTAPAA